MAVSIKLGLKQSQRLTLTQSLRQSIEMLQLSTVELAEKISEELIENPVLEEGETASLPAPDAEQGNLLSRVSQELTGDESLYQRKEEQKNTYEDSSDSGYAGGIEDEDRQRKFIENVVAQEETLKEHLMEQARLTVKDDAELRLLESIITSLDDNGFLKESPEEIARENSVSLEEARRCVALVSAFDPIGCGVRDVRESLLAQASFFYPGDEVLEKILRDYFKELENLNYDRIASGLHISIQEVIRKGKQIQNLDPFPGRQYSNRITRYIIPDVEVRYLDGEILVGLNDDWVPKIRINAYYNDLLRKKSIDKNLKEYIKDKIQSARYLMKNISSRRDTIIRVVGAIMARQKDFLLKGPGFLKPLTHQEISREVELHESTISRVTSNKFVQTSWGVFELKYFFVSRLKSTNEEDHSSDKVMNLIRDIVGNENPENPFSDEDILKRIKKSGINIARRTIAKYRGILNIPPSNKRKKINRIKTEG